jgi:hypothetical protein
MALPVFTPPACFLVHIHRVLFVSEHLFGQRVAQTRVLGMREQGGFLSRW